jgi:hypothetical protein
MTRQKKSGIYKVACLISDEFGALQEAPVSGEKREQRVRSLTFTIQTAQGKRRRGSPLNYSFSTVKRRPFAVPSLRDLRGIKGGGRENLCVLCGERL